MIWLANMSLWGWLPYVVADGPEAHYLVSSLWTMVSAAQDLIVESSDNYMGMGVSENKIHRNSGIAIGLALGIILVGFLALISVIFLYGALGNIFVEVGIDPNQQYLFGQLYMQISWYTALIVAGVAVLIAGVLFERKGVFKGLFEPTGNRLAGAFWGAGGVLAIDSLQNLFYSLLISNPLYYMHADSQLYLEFFIVVGSIGTLLIILGVIANKHRTQPKRMP
jgi:hypothetical protein